MRIRLPIDTGQLRSVPASTARLVNMFAEKLPDDAKAPVLLARTPGVSQYTTVGAGPIQAMHSAFGFLFVVTGGVLYSVDSSLTKTSLGTVGTSADTEFDMDSNVDTVVVVNPPLAYKYDSSFAQITDADFLARGAGDVEFLDNYLLFREPGTARLFSSDLASATSYDALMFATAEGSPDDLVGLKVDHRNALLFGEKSLELWENTGGPDFPFERMINGYVEQGCLNGRTIAKLDNSVYWLADDYTVRRLDGATPVRVSTHVQEQRFRACTIASARACSYLLEGHAIYELSFPEATFAFDVTTQLWHEKQSYGYDYWRWGNAVQFAGNVLVGSTTSNVIGTLDPTVYAENGGTLRGEWTYQPVYRDGLRIFHDRLEMMFEVGVGLSSGQGSDPEVMLSFSDDGGQTWNALPNKKIGKVGEYRNKVVWFGLGSSSQRVYRGAVSDPVRVYLTDTQLEMRLGRAA